MPTFIKRGGAFLMNGGAFVVNNEDCCCEGGPPDGCCEAYTGNIIVTLTTADCPCLDGDDVTMTWNAGTNRWEYSNTNYCGTFVALDMWMECDEINDQYRFHLGCGGSFTEALSSVCDINSLSFSVSGLAGSSCCNNVFNNAVTVSVRKA